jgi:hypothetical protein
MVPSFQISKGLISKTSPWNSRWHTKECLIISHVCSKFNSWLICTWSAILFTRKKIYNNFLNLLDWRFL